MKALAHGELLHNAVEDKDEILFPMVALECKVKLPFTPFVRQFLSELPLHPLQVSPTL